MEPEPRTYTGWKAGLLVIAAVVVMIAALNLVGRVTRDDPPPRPSPTIVRVTPRG